MQTKKEFRYFTIFNHQKEEEYLRRRHKEGWKFVKVSGLCIYRFEKCEPEDVVYQLDYNKEGSSHLGEYIKMFEDCGWDYLQEYAEYSYFRKPASKMNGEEEIFSDDSSRVAMMERVFKGRMIPPMILLCVLLLPLLIVSLIRGQWITAAWLAAYIGIDVAMFTRFVIGYYRLKKGK